MDLVVAIGGPSFCHDQKCLEPQERSLEENERYTIFWRENDSVRETEKTVVWNSGCDIE